MAKKAVAEIVASGNAKTKKQVWFEIYIWDTSEDSWSYDDCEKTEVAAIKKTKGFGAPYHIVKITLPAI